MKSATRRYCEDLGASSKGTDDGLLCYDFTPSMRRRRDDIRSDADFLRDYDERVEACRDAQDDPEAYAALGCKREAHRMVPRGRREGLRGLPDVSDQAPLEPAFTTRLTARDPYWNQLTHRTQSADAAPSKRSAAPMTQRAKGRREDAASRYASLLEGFERQATGGVLVLKEKSLAQPGFDFIQAALPTRLSDLVAVLRPGAVRVFTSAGQASIPEPTKDMSFQFRLATELDKRGLPRLEATLVPPNAGAVVINADPARPFPKAVTDLFGESVKRLVLRRVGALASKAEGPVWVDIQPAINQIAAAFRRQRETSGAGAELAWLLAVNRYLRTIIGDSKGSKVLFEFTRVIPAQAPPQEVQRLSSMRYVVEVPRAVLQHSIQGASGARAARPDYSAFRNLTLKDLAAHLAGYERPDEAVGKRAWTRRRGRYLSPLS